MTTSRRRAQVNGLYVQFDSRNPNLASVRWHSRFKMRYRTKADAIAAKAAWEERGRILFPGDFGKLTAKPKKPAKPRARACVRSANLQQEVRV
jgi:hypothetical protein